MLIRLFTTIYPESDPGRQAEYRECFQRNVDCEELAEVCVLCEGGEEMLPESDKVIRRSITSRPTYNDFFDWVGEVSGPDDLSIVCNSDIYFDSQLRLFRVWPQPEDVVLALSRWEITRGKFRLFDYGDSQDTWIIKGQPRNIRGDFFVGVARCDNRIAAELELAGYRVWNPSCSLKSYHLHDAAPRHYLEPEHSQQIPPPYKYIEPDNLFGFWKTLSHNRKHKDCRLGYRFPRLNVRGSLPARALKRLIRPLRRRPIGEAT